jgi:Glycerophosphoryl diester phosphodiesterase family
MRTTLLLLLTPLLTQTLSAAVISQTWLREAAIPDNSALALRGSVTGWRARSMLHWIRLLPAALLAALALSLSAARGLEIIAHRGASADAPENTLPAMKLAWEQGADAVELDMYLSKDGRIVVFHDTTTKRFDGRERKVAHLTLEEMRGLNVGAWKGEKWAGERVPDLVEILNTIPAGKRAVLEIKCGPEIVPELARVLGAAAPACGGNLRHQFQSRSAGGLEEGTARPASLLSLRLEARSQNRAGH